MKHLMTFTALCLITLVATVASAQYPAPVSINLPAQPNSVPLYPTSSEGSASTERWASFGANPVVRNVTQPTLTPFLPDPAKATGAAVIVAPGGAFMMLAMEEEGWAVARRLAEQGIAAFVLKYRLRPTPADHQEAFAYMDSIMRQVFAPNSRMQLTEPRATLDGLAALRMVRAQASRWAVDPKRVGMMGFSAGAMTTLNVTLEGKPEERPAFIGYLYGPMTSVDVPVDAPPLFAALAMDDPLFGGVGFGIIDSWNRAKRPVELHAYEKGGHGFGTGRQGTTTTLVMDEFYLWLKSRGMLE